MAVLFVHGVPATSRLWKRVIELVDRSDELLAVDLPGMTGECPPGWQPTKEHYVAWLIEQIEAMHERSGGPIHLVGHDWGCLLSLRAASLRPELLRSLTFGNAPIDPHWPLHSSWEIWNRPGTGERMMDFLGATVSQGGMTVMGFPPEDAVETGFKTEEGRRCILGLYRSAVNVGTEWLDDLARIVIPSMAIWGVNDMLVPVEIGRRMAGRIGAEMVELDAGHFWPYQQPEAAAAALRRLWARAEQWPETVLTQQTGPLLAMLDAHG